MSLEFFHCDICSQSFPASPESVIDCHVLEHDEPVPESLPSNEPDEHVLVCPMCEERYVYTYDDGGT